MRVYIAGYIYYSYSGQFYDIYFCAYSSFYAILITTYTHLPLTPEDIYLDNQNWRFFNFSMQTTFLFLAHRSPSPLRHLPLRPGEYLIAKFIH